MNINGKIADYFERRLDEGATLFVLRGGRRSGKTFFVCQFLLGCCSEGDIVNVATMTKEQGRLGAYADCKTIINDNYPDYYDVGKSPRQIESRYPSTDGRKGVMFFNSYADSETAKGIACDWLFVNEANNFSKQQFTDLMANVRKGVILDYNPNIKFWIDDYVTEDEICHTTWLDNKDNLTKAQLDYFDKLKELGDRPDANPVDRRNYLVYYCGEYAEISGKIFHAGNIHITNELPTDLRNINIFCDPSALRGADWFPIVVSAYSPSLDRYVIVETDSTNTGTRELQARKIKDLCARYDGVIAYIETNGIIGVEFYEYCINSGLPAQPWYSRGNKFDRIVSVFEDITEHTIFYRTSDLDNYLLQVFDFDTKCEHDDNIDAVASSIFVQKLTK